jgi:hypothetical protein
MITEWETFQAASGSRATSAPVFGVENFGRAKGGRGRSSARHE